jgi:hypothetical protein
VERLDHLFYSPTCRIIRVSGSHGTTIGTHRYEWSFESKVSFALDVGEGLRTQDARELGRKLLDSLPARIEAGHADRGDLVSLLTSEAFRGFSPTDAVFAASKRCLVHQLREFDDFRSFTRFIESFPDAVSQEDIRRVRSEFEEFCGDYSRGWDKDPELLRSVADDIERVGGKLGAEVQRFSDRLTNEANELEAESGRVDPEPDDEDSSWRGVVEDDQRVELMFETLLNEIIETGK